MHAILLGYHVHAVGVQAILKHTGVLKCLLGMQTLDTCDVEGIQPLCAHALFHIRMAGARSFLNLRLVIVLVPCQLVLIFAACADVDIFDPTKKMCGDPEVCPWMVEWGLQRTQLFQDGVINDQEACKHWETLQALHEMTWQDVRDVLHSHCLAVAAKDCSIVLSYTIKDSARERECRQSLVMDCNACKCDADRFWNMLAPTKYQAGSVKRLPQLDHSCVGCVCMDAQVIRYRLGVVDMDRKSITKIDKHLALDQQILHCWKQRQ